MRATMAASRSWSPVDPLRQVGDDREIAVVEADGAGVLAGAPAAGGGSVGVA
jgi:hypothetical protein